jgi:predicted nucleotidyltransferase
VNPAEPIAELEAKVAAALNCFPQVRLAYLFGSHTRGTARPDSDLDLAVYWSEASRDRERAALMLQLIDALSRTVGSLGERVDLLDFDRASSTLAFRVIRDGRLLVCREPRERVALEARIARRYDDERPYRELFRRAARAAAERMAQARRDG